MPPPGVELRRGPVPGAERDPDRRGARLRRGPPAPVRARAARPAPPPPGAPGRARRRACGPTSWSPRATCATSDWTVAPAPADLDDRRVEITGPAEPKMMINALNSGARVFMADLEDALSPTWANVVGGQAALADAVRRTLVVRIARRARPTGWPSGPRRSSSGRAAGTSSSRGMLVDGVPVSASLFDFGLYLFHNGRRGGAARERPVPLPGQARIAPRGAALERGLRPRPDRARDPARDDPGDRADRDDPRRVRDGRDPVRAARARGGTQRGALGLPVQRDQEAPVVARAGRARTAPS